MCVIETCVLLFAT